MTPAHPVASPNLGGRTGDLEGNLNRVKRELRRIRFPVDFDAGAAREGNPMALLPALHYALLGFSRHVTSSLVDAGHDLQAKSDARFVENAWRALREAFGYNPALSPSQFLSPGFAERKLMLLHDAVELCKRRHNEHARRKRAEETAAAVNREGVPRVARAVAEKRGAEAREGRDAETAGRNRARFSASSVGRAPSAFAITRHAGGVPGGEAHTDTGGRARGEDHASAPGAHRERRVPSPGSDAGSDFEFSRPSLGGDVSRAARPRAPLDEVDAPVEPWFARSSRSSKRGEATGGTTAVATDASRDTATSAPATSAPRGFSDENAPPDGGGSLAAAPSTRGDDEIAGSIDSVTRLGFFSNRATEAKQPDDVRWPRIDTRDGLESAPARANPETPDTNPDPARGEASALGEALERRVAESERRAAAAVDAARAAEQVAARAVAACQETVEQMLGERARGAQLAAALAEQTAKSLLLETRVRALERAASLDAEARDQKNAAAEPLSHLPRRGEDRAFLKARPSSTTADREDVSSLNAGASPPRSPARRSNPFEVRRDPDPREKRASFARAAQPAPSETGAFIDFYSGVLGVDRAALTLER